MRQLLINLGTIISTWRSVLLLIWQTQPGLVVTLIVLTVLNGMTPAVQIQLTSSIIQTAALAIHNGHPQNLINLALLFGILQGVLLLISSLLSLGSQQVQTLLILQLSNKISIKVMEKAASLDVQHYEDAAFYDKLQRASNESGFRPYQIFSQMSALMGQGVTLVSVVGVLISWNWWLGLLILCAPLPSVGARFFYSRRGYLIERERTGERRRLAYFQFLVTHAYSVKEVRLFRLGSYFIERYKDLYQHFYQVDSRLARQQSLAQLPFTLLTTVAAVGAQLYAISMTIAIGQLGFLAGYMQAISIVQGTVQSLLIGIAQLYQNHLFIQNLFEFLDTSVRQIKSGTRQIPKRLSKGIEFRNVSFSYPGNSVEVLHDFNLFLRPGECIALVGRNGAGKTTLVKLLTRLYEPTSGQIFIDEIPIEEYDLDDLRRHISAIFQDFVQYEMKARENVGFGCIEEVHNHQHIVQAAKRSEADKFIEQLAEQYETTLGRMFAKGEQLSGGQWQKVALARAFMSRAPIVILDEPTASLDAESEAKIFARIRQNTMGAMTILVAHRFSTVRQADRILVIEQGQIIEEGNHEELLHLNGTYACLFRLQAKGYLDEKQAITMASPLPVGDQDV